MGAAIQAEGLRKRFGETQAVDGFDVVVAPGTVCGLLGPNGAGKTTVVRILATLLRADSGRALIDGVDVTAEPHEVRRRIGWSGQAPAVDEVLAAARTSCCSAASTACARRRPGAERTNCSSVSTSRRRPASR